jgi:hypothetical protein
LPTPVDQRLLRKYNVKLQEVAEFERAFEGGKY